MKLLAVGLILFLASCSSKPPEGEFNTWLLIHNQKAHMMFFNDSLTQATNIEISYIGRDKNLMNERIKTSGDVFKDNWNEPYDIKKDYELTLEKYMDYCKANKKDAKTFFKFID